MRRRTKPASIEKVTATFKDQMRAHAIYDLMARKAKKDEQMLACKIFRETARQELTHAEVLGSFLDDQQRQSAASDECSFPVHQSTEANVEESVSGETRDRDEYHEAAEIAENEGFGELVFIFGGLAEAENYHRARFEVLLAVLRGEHSDELGWKCMRCGWVKREPEKPSGCEVCDAESGHFKPLSFENAINSLL